MNKYNIITRSGTKDKVYANSLEEAIKIYNISMEEIMPLQVQSIKDKLKIKSITEHKSRLFSSTT